MTFHKLAAARGAGWISDGIAVFSKQPGAYIQACLLVGFLGSLPYIGIVFGLLMPVFYGGLLSLLHCQASGGIANAGQAFDGFNRPGAFARLLPIILANLALATVFVAIIAAVLGSSLIELYRSEQADPQLFVALLPKLALLVVIFLPIGIFFSWVMMLALPRAMLDEVPGLEAIQQSITAVMGNIAPMLINLLCLMLIMFVVIVIFMIPMGVIGMLQASSPTLSMLLGIPLSTVLTAVILVLYCATMHQAWREVFTDVAAAPTDEAGSISA